jgi:hypothetical protein
VPGIGRNPVGGADGGRVTIPKPVTLPVDQFLTTMRCIMTATDARGVSGPGIAALVVGIFALLVSLISRKLMRESYSCSDQWMRAAWGLRMVLPACSSKK